MSPTRDGVVQQESQKSTNKHARGQQHLDDLVQLKNPYGGDKSDRDYKMGRGSWQRLSQRRCPDDQRVHERCSASLTAGKCKPKPQWGSHLTPVRMAFPRKNWQVLARVWKNRNPYASLMGLQISAAIWKTAWMFLKKLKIELPFSSVQSLSRVWLFATPWFAACQASLSTHMIQQFHFWIFIQRKWKHQLKKTHAQPHSQ